MTQWVFIHKNDRIMNVINANSIDTIEYNPKTDQTLIYGATIGIISFRGDVIDQLDSITRHGNPTAHVEQEKEHNK